MYSATIADGKVTLYNGKKKVTDIIGTLEKIMEKERDVTGLALLSQLKRMAKQEQARSANV